MQLFYINTANGYDYERDIYVTFEEDSVEVFFMGGSKAFLKARYVINYIEELLHHK